MSADSAPGAQLEIGHVLFMDVVGYSKLLINQQRELQEQLSEIVRNTECFRAAESSGRLVRLPVGDGMALVFFNSPEAPLQCAIEIQRALKKFPHIQLRMGIHSGPINQVRDVNDRTNIAGAGINMAQRVMDCADANHILVSKRVAEDLAQSGEWQPHFHDLGQCHVKHDVEIDIFNFYNSEVGNAAIPEKLRQAQQERATQRLPWRNIIIAVALLLIGLVAFFVYEKRFAHSSSLEKSIAVMPFVNMSAERENAFFADGIQEDILTSLAKIKDLRVISRTSVMGYRGGKTTHNLPEIGRALSVTNVLEGSVRREGNRIVVSVQLIDALQDRHLWAKRYDRTLADSLGLQGELATEIAEALRVTLSPDEKERVTRKPTENEGAYVFYLRANQIARNPDTLLEDYKRAEQLYREAIALDPKFAVAHAQLASTCAQVFHFFEPTDEWKTKARNSANTALGLQANLAEAHFALGECIYWIDGDYDRALHEFDIAAELAPNNADVRALIAAIKRRQGKWQEAIDAYETSQRIDPQNPNVVRNLVFTNTSLRRWGEASRWAEQMRSMAPASLVAKIQSGYVEFWWRGDVKMIKDLVAQVPPGTDPDGVVTSARWEVAMLERDFDAAQKVLESSSVNEVSYTNAGVTPKSLLLGYVFVAKGDNAHAQKSLALAQSFLEADVKEAPDSADRHANLGCCYAFMGRKEDAIREGRRAVELKPESKDATDGPIMSAYLALIYARIGEKDLAISLIERLLKTPGAVDSADYSITVNDLKYRWEWDPIRNDPRFQKLIAQPNQ